jgi:hypothetical protein
VPNIVQELSKEAEMANANFKMSKLDPKTATLTIKVDVRELRVRLAIGVWLIKLGARVIGLSVSIEPLENTSVKPIITRVE